MLNRLNTRSFDCNPRYERFIASLRYHTTSPSAIFQGLKSLLYAICILFYRLLVWLVEGTVLLTRALYTDGPECVRSIPECLSFVVPVLAGGAVYWTSWPLQWVYWRLAHAWEER